MYYVSRFLSFFDPPAPLVIKSKHFALVLRKVFLTPHPLAKQKSHVVGTYDGQTTPGKKVHMYYLVFKGQKQIVQSLYLPEKSKNFFQEGDFANYSAFLCKICFFFCYQTQLF